MSKYIVVVFPNESAAYKGVGALKDLHKEGSLSLYSYAVVEKSADGDVTLKEEQDDWPKGAALGMMVGALFGVLAGPAGLLIGSSSGAFLGSLSDLNNIDVGLDFLELVNDKMDAGTIAIVSEIDENWITPLDTRMEDLGGEVFRRSRIDFEDEQMMQELQTWNDEKDALEAEKKEASAERKAKLEAKKEEIQKNIEKTKEKINNKITKLKEEHEAKEATLKKQRAESKAEHQASIDATLEKLKSDHNARIEKLKIK